MFRLLFNCVVISNRKVWLKAHVSRISFLIWLFILIMEYKQMRKMIWFFRMRKFIWMLCKLLQVHLLSYETYETYVSSKLLFAKVDPCKVSHFFRETKMDRFFQNKIWLFLKSWQFPLQEGLKKYRIFHTLVRWVVLKKSFLIK